LLALKSFCATRKAPQICWNGWAGERRKREHSQRQHSQPRSSAMGSVAYEAKIVLNRL
jgi:hypothetical protein